MVYVMFMPEKTGDAGRGKKLYIVYENVERRNLLQFHILIKFIVFSIKIPHNKIEIQSGKHWKR